MPAAPKASSIASTVLPSLSSLPLSLPGHPRPLAGSWMRATERIGREPRSDGRGTRSRVKAGRQAGRRDRQIGSRVNLSSRLPLTGRSGITDFAPIQKEIPPETRLAGVGAGPQLLASVSVAVSGSDDRLVRCSLPTEFRESRAELDRAAVAVAVCHILWGPPCTSPCTFRHSHLQSLPSCCCLPHTPGTWHTCDSGPAPPNIYPDLHLALQIVCLPSLPAPFALSYLRPPRSPILCTFSHFGGDGRLICSMYIHRCRNIMRCAYVYAFPLYVQSSLACT